MKRIAAAFGTLLGAFATGQAAPITHPAVSPAPAALTTAVPFLLPSTP